jgi:hypothetical protein
MAGLLVVTVPSQVRQFWVKFAKRWRRGPPEITSQPALFSLQ